MSENILKALMQLFAIIAKVDSANSSERIIVQTFLRQQLNQQLAEQYLHIFDEFIQSSQQASQQKKDGNSKRKSLNSVKVLKICSEINNELTQAQKIVVLIRLIEFIGSNDIPSEEDIDFVSTVSESFNIQNNEFKNCMSFVLTKDTKEINSPNIIILDNKDGIVGSVRILWVQSVNLYAMLYDGTDELQLNGHFVTEGKVYILTPGSSFKSSKTKSIYYSDIISIFLRDALKEKLSFEVEDLEYVFKNGKTGLHKLSFNEESGKLIGIMGGSGSGKSTLINVLNGNVKPSKGSVKINGINIHVERAKLEGVIGYISQDDLLIEELTVFQNLYYNTKLCFGNKSEEEIKLRVESLLNIMGLAESMHLKVGNPLEKTISGGQRKRLNIALELIREPSVLFVDEPTSGLSSRDSENIMDLLKELALKGKLVFVVIHQPASNIFKLFDDLIVLDDGGYPIYYGNPVDAVVYFKKITHQANSSEIECIECGNVNPEQIFNIIDSKVLDEFGNRTRNRKISPIEWNAFYKKKIEPNIKKLSFLNSKIPDSGLKVPNVFNQFNIFFKRDILSKLTNKQYLLINIFEAPFLALVLAYFSKFYDVASGTGEYVFRFNENIPVYLFMSIIVAIFIGLTVSAEEIIRDKKILKRESFLNLNRGSYLSSKIAIMFLWSAMQTFLYVIVGNSVLGIQGLGFHFWLLLFSISCFSNLLGLNISSGFNSVVNIYILIPFLIVPQLLFSGAIVSFDKLNPSVSSQRFVPIIGDLMISRWGLEAAMVKQFKDNEYKQHIYPLDKEMSIVKYKKDYWLGELQKKLNHCTDNFNNADQIVQPLQLLKHELTKEMKYLNIDPTTYQFLTRLDTSNYNFEATLKISKLMDNLSHYYVNRFNLCRHEKDSVIGVLTASPELKSQFTKLRENYDNEAISDLVTNKNSFKKLIEYENEIIQKTDPIYCDATASNYGRAHMYAPRKLFLGNYIDTYTFNLWIIWLYTAVLFITLYFNVLRRLLKIEWFKHF